MAEVYERLISMQLWSQWFYPKSIDKSLRSPGEPAFFQPNDPHVGMKIRIQNVNMFISFIGKEDITDFGRIAAPIPFRLNFTHAAPEKLKLGMTRLSEVLGKVKDEGRG